jgi:hypothetical protein
MNWQGDWLGPGCTCKTAGWRFGANLQQSVATEFNRHNERKLLIGDPQTGRLQVGGKFRVTDLEGFVAALAVTHGVKATFAVRYAIRGVAYADRRQFAVQGRCATLNPCFDIG